MATPTHLLDEFSSYYPRLLRYDEKSHYQSEVTELQDRLRNQELLVSKMEDELQSLRNHNQKLLRQNEEFEQDARVSNDVKIAQEKEIVELEMKMKQMEVRVEDLKNKLSASNAQVEDDKIDKVGGILFDGTV